MTRTSASTRVRRAQAELSVAQAALERDANACGFWARRRRGALAAGGGFVAGMLLTLLPARWWSRAGALTGASAAIAARSVLLPMLVGAAFGRIDRGAASRSTRNAPS